MPRRLLVMFVPVALLLAACSSDSDTTNRTTTTKRPTGTSSSAAPSSSTAPTAGRNSTSTTAGPTNALSGPGGTGNFRWSVVSARSEFCYRIALDAHGAASKASLYRGAPGEAGSLVLELVPPGGDGTVDTCSAGDQILVEEVKAQPALYFVQVTTSKGTLRGQLA